MTLLVGVETLLLVLLSVLVIGLLRSHAEILRRLEVRDDRVPLPAPAARITGRAAADIAGTTPAGDARSVSLSAGAPDTLLAFLSSGCSICGTLLDQLERGEGVPRVPRLVVVTKDAPVERARRFAAAADVAHVVMSGQAWEDYAVPGSPYFVYVDGASGLVAGEGSAPSWDRVASLVGEMLDEPREGGTEAGDRVGEQLAAAGIGHGHPSLYPSRSWSPNR